MTKSPTRIAPSGPATLLLAVFLLSLTACSSTTAVRNGLYQPGVDAYGEDCGEAIGPLGLSEAMSSELNLDFGIGAWDTLIEEFWQGEIYADLGGAVTFPMSITLDSAQGEPQVLGYDVDSDLCPPRVFQTRTATLEADDGNGVPVFNVEVDLTFTSVGVSLLVVSAEEDISAVNLGALDDGTDKLMRVDILDETGDLHGQIVSTQGGPQSVVAEFSLVPISRN